MRNNLKEQLHDWTDRDVALRCLGVALGLFDEDPYAKIKPVLWTNNQISNALQRTLDELHRANVLLKRDDPDYQYRWNHDFTGSWETPR